MPIGCESLTTGCPPGVATCTIAALCESRNLTCGDTTACVVPDVPVDRYDVDAERAPDVRRVPVEDSGMDSATDAATDARDAAACDPATCAARPNSVPSCDASGRCAYACASGFADCDGQAANGCEASLSSTDHCGACGTRCSGATPFCDGAAQRCVNGCSAPTTRCGMSCVDTASDGSNCGACGTACRGDQRCTAGVCRCAGGSECGGRCVDTSTDRGNCGACGVSCRADQSCVGGSCRCGAGMDCAGACVDTSNNVAHCGACGRSCSFSQASATCVAGACRLDRCAPGWGNCDGNDGNGCEQDLSSASHCGRCGNGCSGATPVCSGGECASGCGGGEVRCGATCATLNTDRNHCGACNRACRADQNCVGGTCQCAAGTDCSGVCVDTNTSAAHCGACNRACAPANATGSCVGGACRIVACDSTWDNCNGNVTDGCEARLDTTSNCRACGNACVAGPMQSAGCGMSSCSFACTSASFQNCNGSNADGCEANVDSDPDRCGACGNVCPTRANATRRCTARSCGFTCNTNFADCDAMAANGCETDLRSDPMNCGACGTTCGGAGICSGRACACPAGLTLCGGNCVDLNIASTHCGACGVACVANAGCCGGTCVPGIGLPCAHNCTTESVRVCGPMGTGEGICPPGGPLFSPPSSVAGVQCENSSGWGFCGGSGMCNLL
jgi:hypothetical protein